MEISPVEFNFQTERLVRYLYNWDCNVNVVKQMILLGADVNFRDSSSNTLLHIVLRHCFDKFNLVHELLIAGTPVNASNVHEKSSLHYAVQFCNNVDVLRELIIHGAVVNLRDIGNDTPLHLAVRTDKKAFVQVLIQLGADVNVRNFKEETPLTIAVKNGNLAIVKLLLSQGASVHRNEQICSSPLHVAVQSPVPVQGILIELMKYGANMYCMNSSLHFPLEDAIRKYYADPSDNFHSARTLLKCDVLQCSPGVEKQSVFSYLKKYDIFPQLIIFNEECILEMKRMKSKFIHKNFCLFDFVLEGFECKPMFQKKTMYRERIFNQILHISRDYPIYSDIIAYRLGKLDLCLKSMELCISAVKVSPMGKQKILLTPDAVFQIGRFLTCKDVLNLITAFSDSQHFATPYFGFQTLALGKSIKRKLSGNSSIIY